MSRYTKKINPFLIRSLLFVPAIKKNFVDKILLLKGNNKPDVIIFDLEDSIDKNFKVYARDNLVALFKDVSLATKVRKKYLICIRINRYGTRWFKEDMAFANIVKPDFLMLPKVSSADDLRTIKKMTSAKQIIVTIETLSGFRNLSKITAEINYYDLLAIGYEDISSELLIERPANINFTNPLAFFLMNCLIECRMNDLLIVDGPSRKYLGKNSLKNLERECIINRNNGLNCKMAIHPNQLSIINKTFDKKFILKKAVVIMNKFKQLSYGSSVTINDKKEIIDTPTYEMYKKILEYSSR